MLTPNGGFASSSGGQPQQPQQPMQPQPGFPGGPAGIQPISSGGASGTLGGFDVKRLLTSFLHRWPLIVLCCLLGGTWGFTQYSVTTKEYRTAAMVQIERNRLEFMAMGRNNWLEDYWNQEYYPTQISLLMSRGMAENVVEAIRLEEEAKDPTEPRSAQALAILRGDTVKHAKRMQGGVSVKPVRNTQLIRIEYRSSSPEWAARAANSYAEAFIEWNRETRQSTIGEATSFLDRQIESLRAEISNMRMELFSYSQNNDFVLDPSSEVQNRRSILEKQYGQALANRIEKETAYLRVLEMPEDEVAEKYATNAVKVSRSSIRAMESEYQDKLSLFRPEWPTMVDLRDRTEAARNSLQELYTKTKDEIVDKSYDSFQRAEEREQVLEATLRNFQGESPELHTAALKFGNLLTVIKARTRLLEDLVHRRSEADLASRYGSYQDSNVRLVDRAMKPGSAYKPILKKDLTQGLLIGLGIGVLLIGLLEFLDRSIKTPAELERLVKLPNLAVVPDVSHRGESYGLRTRIQRGRYRGYTEHGYGYGYGYGSGHRPAWEDEESPESKKGPVGVPSEPRIELLPHFNPRLDICEAYRSLRTSLLLSSAEKLEVIGVTSAEPGEGKTSTSANLAVVLAQLEKRVLVIDADLRRPRMHQVFGITNRQGLVSHLTAGVELDQLLVESMVPNLSVIPSGPIPPNPSELLASERMRRFLAEAREKFDYVIIDTPPALPVADAIMLGRMTDGMILCARAGMLQRDTGRTCAERLRQAGLRMLGTVLNCYRSHPQRYYRPYHYYGIYDGVAPPSDDGVGSSVA